MSSKRGMKRKLEAEVDESSDSSGLFVRDRPSRAKKRSTRGKSLSRLNEEGEDEGRKSSRNFQQWAQWLEKLSKDEAKKSKDFFAAFQKKADKQKEQIQKLLDGSEKALKEKNVEFTAAFERLTDKITLSPNQRKDGQSACSAKESSKLFQSAKALIDDSHTLLRSFKDKDKLLETRQLDQSMPSWAKDKKDIAEILTCGREYFEQVMEGNLDTTTNACDLVGFDKPRDTEQEQIALDMTKQSLTTLEGETWGISAGEQLKQFAKLAESITSHTQR